jgi:hypothetical protein
MLTLCFLTILVSAQQPARIKSVYVGKDAFNNELLRLYLYTDNSYRYEERFIDGSALLDSGIWVMRNKEIILTSSAKTKRQHHFLQFEKVYKFRKEVFEQVGDKLRIRSTRTKNAYLKGYMIEAPGFYGFVQ